MINGSSEEKELKIIARNVEFCSTLNGKALMPFVDIFYELFQNIVLRSGLPKDQRDVSVSINNIDSSLIIVVKNKAAHNNDYINLMPYAKATEALEQRSEVTLRENIDEKYYFLTRI